MSTATFVRSVIASVLTFVYAWREVSSLQSQTSLKSFSKEELEHGYSEV